MMINIVNKIINIVNHNKNSNKDDINKSQMIMNNNS